MMKLFLGNTRNQAEIREISYGMVCFRALRLKVVYVMSIFSTHNIETVTN